MAPHSRKASLKRVAPGEDANHLTLGIKEVRFVSPDYKTKHHIGRRGTHVLTYNETLLHYRVMANACLEESAVKQKISGKKPSNKIALKDKTKKSAKKVTSNDSLVTYAAKNSSVNSFNKESLIKRSGKKCPVKDSRKVSKRDSCIKRSTANNPVKKSIAKEMLAQNTTTGRSAVKNYAKPLSKKHSINYTLKKKTVKTAWKFSSKHIKKKLSKTSDLPTIEENLLELNQCKKLSVCLIRLKREASLNAAAKVKLIYNENQQNTPERRKPRDSESGNLHKTKDPPVLKNGQFFKTSKSHSSDSKCSLSQSKDGVCTNKKKNFDLLPFRTVKPFIRTVSETLKKETCKEKSCLIENKTKDITSMQNKFNRRIQNPFTPCNSPENQTMQNKEKRKNNSNKGFTKKSKRFIGYECSEKCIACRFHTNDYLVGFVDQTKQNCMNQQKCQFIEPCINTKDDSAPKERNPSCFLHLTNNKRIIFSPQKNILSKYANSYDKNEDMVYGSPKKESESCFPDYGNLNRYIRDNMNATNNDSLSVGTAQTSCPNNCQHINKYAVRDHSLHFDHGSTTAGLPSNFYDSTGPHLCKSDKEYCCTATRHDFCQTKCQKHCTEESSAGKLSKRMASLNAQAIMDACQESQYSKRELLQNSQRSARTHYIFSPKRQSCRWVDGLGGMYLAKDLQNSSSNDLKQKIVSCSTTNPDSSSNVSRNMSKNCSITSNNNHSPDMQLQTKIHERIKQKPDNSFEGAPQFSKFNNAISTSQGRQEIVSCCSFPYMHGENVSPTKCQTFTLNGVGSISSQPYQPYRSHFSLHCNHASIPHYKFLLIGKSKKGKSKEAGCYSNDSCYSRSSTMVQSKPFMITSPIPIHVPHAEVKVLIHSPHPSQPFIPTTADSPKQHKNKRGNQTVQNKKKLDTRQKNDSTKTVNIRSKPKLGKRNCDLKEGPLKKVEKQYLPSKRKKPNSSNSGWSWEGEPEMKPVMDLNIDAPPVERKCYPAIKHTDGECIRVRDCVLLRSGPRKNDLPFTAKVVAFWENSTDGEMMMSLLWYYRPEHTESGRQPHNIDCEIFASKHRDINNVACIEEKCYVLTFNEYCRYKAEIRRSESNLPARQKVVPASESYHRQNRLPPVDADSETVFLCRKVYHFRQKRILKS